MKNCLKISLLITKLSISQHLYVRYVIIRKGPVTLLRMRETYEKRMEINEIIFIRTKIL